jgi:hypothetical protein
MTRSLCLALILTAVMVHAQEAASPAKPDIEALLGTCDARLEVLQQQATSARRTGNILLIVGASIAALGSALAGFLTKSSHRKAMAIIGAVGAVVAVLPKTLDDPTELLTRRAAAERHRDMALKVKLQLPELPQTYESLGRQYIGSRVVDCNNSTPPEKVPDPPDVPPDFSTASDPSAEPSERTSRTIRGPFGSRIRVPLKVLPVVQGNGSGRAAPPKVVLAACLEVARRETDRDALLRVLEACIAVRSNND